MIWSRRKKPKPPKTNLSVRSYNALAIMLLLSQLPHVLHLPVWISALGFALVAMKWWNVHNRADTGPTHKLGWLLSSRSAVFWAIAGGVLIKLSYGHFLARDPFVAFLFLLVACKYAETRSQSDATTLMCLSGFLLLTQYFYSQDILSAVLTLPAVVSLGVALSVLTEHTPRKLKTHTRLIGKLLLQGAPIAALLFILFPRLPGPLWALPEGSAATIGLSDSMSPGEISNLSQSDEVAFRVEFDGTPPAVSDLYWRGPVMSNFDGREWTINELTPDGQVEKDSTAQSVSYSVTLQPHNKKWLFALEQASALPKSTKEDEDPSDNRLRPVIRNDQQIRSGHYITQITRYKQSSLLRDRYTPSKPPGALDLHLAGKNPKTAAFANKLYREQPSDEAYVRAVLNWFTTQPYHYTLQPSLLGESPVDEFMFDSKNGFCGHYASAFVVMMRAAGIPARIVTGYLGGEMNGDYMIVRQSEAHAWAEVYINGQWIRSDPTAAVAPSRIDLGLAEALPDGEPVPMLARVGNGWLKQASLRWDKINHGWQSMVVNFNDESQSKFWEKLGMPDPQLWQITAMLLLLATGWCLWILRPASSKANSLSEDEKYWQTYRQNLNDIGIKQAPGETGSELTARARTLLPEHDSLLKRLGLAFTKLRFEPTSNSRQSSLRVQLKRDLKKLAAVARQTKAQRFLKISAHQQPSSTT